VNSWFINVLIEKHGQLPVVNKERLNQVNSRCTYYLIWVSNQMYYIVRY